MIRSLLFVPGDSLRKFERASEGSSDALILDLEDSVAPSGKQTARTVTSQMLGRPRGRQLLYVRINALDTGLALADLAAVMPASPDGIVLPKCTCASDVVRLGHYLDAFEAASGAVSGKTRILAIATETADSLFSLGSYRGCSPRLWGMLWGGEDLAAALGASANRDGGEYLGPYRLARDLCLAGARAAEVVPVDAVYVDINNLDGLRQEALNARRDGFEAKAVIHPVHADIVNSAFMPDAKDIDWARRVVSAYEAAPNSGVLSVDGKMVDRPHLVRAKQILQTAAAESHEPSVDADHG
jgi:citrate lyase subunit beta/citryl-CoA lyase